MFELCAVQVRKYLLIDYSTEGTPKGILAVRNQEAVQGSACIRFYHLWRKKQLAEVDKQCDSRGHTPLHPDIIRECYKFKCAPCENNVYDSMLYQESLGCSHHLQICPKLPFGAEPEPLRILDQTPNPLDSVTSSKKSVVPMKPVHVSASVPMDIGLSVAQSSAFVPMGGSRPNGDTSSQCTKLIGPSPSDHLSTSPASGTGSLALPLLSKVCYRNSSFYPIGDRISWNYRPELTNKTRSSSSQQFFPTLVSYEQYH